MKKPALTICFSILVLAFLFSQLLTHTGCANIMPPEGGFKDTLPPILTKATPPNQSRNFGEDRITFSFDEYIDLENYQQNLIVSPLPQNAPNVTRKLNTITVKLRDTLEPNTTYSFNFGQSIKDINEGNIMQDFTYVFTTGSFFDSLELSGRVVLAQTGETDTTLTVMLHREKDDSAVIKNRPRYITRLNGNGIFHFKNLSPGTYYVYALKDEGSYRYLSSKQLFAFSDQPVQPGIQSDSVILYAYSAEETKGIAPPAARTARPAEKRMKYQTNQGRNIQDLLDSLVINFDVPLRGFDSTKIHFTTDSLFTPAPGGRWSLDSTGKKLVLNYPWKERTLYNLVLEKDFATDTLDQQLLKTDTISFTTRALNEYGKLSIRFRNLELFQNPVLQFIENDEVKVSFPLTGPNFTQPLFEPGEYNLRILTDSNKNGRWDPGEFFGKHKQPEIAKPLTRKVTVRPSWDNAIEIIL